MRWLLTSLALVAGCTLDLDRLYGLDGADGGLDAPNDAPMDGRTDTADLDAPRDVPFDVTVLDVPGDAGGGVLGLRVGATMVFGPASTSVAAARSPAGVAVVAMTGGEQLIVYEVTRTGCSLGLTETRREAPNYPGPVALGLVDGGDVLDVVVLTSESELQTFLGTATMGVPSPLYLSRVAAISLGDFDGSFTDVLLVEAGTRLRILGGDGRGNFGAMRAESGVGIRFLDGTFADVDSNGSLDVVTLQRSGSEETLIVQTGNGAGVLGGPMATALTPPGSERFTFGPLTAMGSSDAYIVGAALRVASGIGGAGGGTLLREGLPGIVGDDIVIAELDGVDPAELVVSDSATGSIYVFNWSSPLPLVDTLRLPMSPTELAVVDVDDDGIDELFIAGSTGLMGIVAGCR